MMMMTTTMKMMMITLTPFTRAKKIGTARQIFGTVPCLPVLRLPPGGSLGTPKILSTGATLHLGPIRFVP